MQQQRPRDETRCSVEETAQAAAPPPANADQINLSALTLPATPEREAGEQKPPLIDVEVPSNIAAAPLSIARRAANFCAKTFDSFCDRIASDPRVRDSILGIGVKLGIDLIPFIGPFKKYADARALFKTGDPALQDEGRKLFLIALTEAGLDIATLGGSALLFDEALTWLRQARDYFRKAAIVRNKPGFAFPDPLSLGAGLLLRSGAIKGFSDKCLRFATKFSG